MAEMLTNALFYTVTALGNTYHKHQTLAVLSPGSSESYFITAVVKKHFCVYIISKIRLYFSGNWEQTLVVLQNSEMH